MSNPGPESSTLPDAAPSVVKVTVLSSARLSIRIGEFAVVHPGFAYMSPEFLARMLETAVAFGRYDTAAAAAARIVRRP